MNETIVALATPLGKSGVAVIRISGVAALQSVKALGVTRPLTPRKAQYVKLSHHVTEEVIDYGLVLYFAAPHSFTGEDVVEIQCHGSRAVIREIIDVLLSCEGIRYAEAGEFTRRALEKGKMDLVQVEALMDLIESETPLQKTLALRQLGGEISSQYDTLERLLIEARAFCEVFIDFPDDDLPDTMDAQINEKITACRDHIMKLLSTARAGQQIREGTQVAIVGVPNAGKSTLINAIAGRQVAITSPIEGTTRDAIEHYKDIDGIPYRFFDTAGLREAEDEIERQGVAIAKRLSDESDVTLCLLDATQSIPEQLRAIDENVSRETIWVLNKCDAVNDLPKVTSEIAQNVSRETFCISAKDGAGVKELLTALSARREPIATDAIFVTRERHVAHLRRAFIELEKSTTEYDLVLKSEYLIQACREVGYILGKIHIERVLDVLFSSFCIGK
jgi:tRNA modification GTPase